MTPEIDQMLGTLRDRNDKLCHDAANEIEKLHADLMHAANLNRDVHQIIWRIWDIFGTPTYEELAGRSIYDLVKAAKDSADETQQLHNEVARLQADLASWETTAKLVDQAEQAPLCDILRAHETEKKVLYEALERALSHFAVMETDQAMRAANEIEAVLAQKPTPNDDWSRTVEALIKAARG